MFNDYVEYTIAAHFLSAIINQDRTGLDDDEEQALNEFLSSLFSADGCWEIADNDFETHFARCDILDMHVDCVNVNFHFHNTNILAN